MSDSIQKPNDIAPMQDSNAAEKSKDPLQAEYEQGKAFLERGEIGQAAVALHNALIGCQEKNNENGIANASNQLGIACLRKEEYDKALEHFQRAERICEKLDDPLSLAALSKQFILVYTETGMYNEAVKRCLDLLDYYRGNNDPKGSVDTLERMAEIYLRSGEKHKAADSYRTIASIHRNFKHANIAAEYLRKAEELE